ncbi:putative PurR-regulated permease PerM [Neolewinella xylanilytica]|uniref:Putative PurR-regulated permease PerM n=1 Tax=Neolewinella xylanilytica TaxID=1514080 RepID=A0A2S6I8H3_9BACT|nr:AI-2E family transporter [Neolewinella xylanilytica]PPK87791.1 putative PurR-regulated permease PerM [Neolewinella xylanilytica]
MKVSPKLVGFVLRLFAIIGVVAILYFGKSVLLLLTVAGLIAILLNPVDNKLRSWGWKPGLAIAASVFLLVLFFAGIFFAIGQQATSFAQNWPEIEDRISQQIERAKEQIPVLPGGATTEASDSTSTGQQSGSASGQSADGGSSGGSMLQNLPFGQSQITGALSSTLSVLGDFLLMFVYIVLFLSQKERLREFVLRRAPDEKRGETHQTINEALDVAQQYLKGRLILILILSVLYGVGFSLVGLNYAIVIAVLVAILSIIPYLGNIIGGGIAVAIAVASGGGTTMILGVLGTMAVAQVLESYILTPLIVGDEVDINPLTTIVAVIAFTVMWGAVGAIVAIPVVAIMRIVFKHINGMEDYAYLLGQE